MSCPPGAAVEEIVDDLFLPAEMQLLQPQVDRSQGSGQRDLRVRQPACPAADGAVLDCMASVFPFPDGTRVLSTALTDPRGAERLLSDVGVFAAGVRLQEAL